MTTITPPAAPHQVPPPLPPRGGPSAASRVVAIIAIVVGGLIILGAIGSAVVSTVFNASERTSAATVDTSGVDDLDVDISAGTLRIEFADIDEAELEVRSTFGADRWTLDRDGETLRVESPRGVFGAGWLFGGAGDAVLRLPDGLEGLDADLGISAGDLQADGEFGSLTLEVSAGYAQVQGSADDLAVDLSAGRADIDLAGVREGRLTVSAGDLVGALTGAAPSDLTIDVSAGSLSLDVPEGEYDVRSDVEAGDFDNRIGSVPGASSTVTVTVSAGSATLRAG